MAMTDIGRRPGVPALAHWASCGVIAALLLAHVARANDPPAIEARSGLDIASAAAQLVGAGRDADLPRERRRARRHRPGTALGPLPVLPATTDKARAYSVRNGKILTAENPDMKFVAPAVESGWIDSGAALVAAENWWPGASSARARGQARHHAPDARRVRRRELNRTTWLLVYTTPDAPSRCSCGRAADGKVARHVERAPPCLPPKQFRSAGRSRGWLAAWR
jgi:hypothetical protein